MGYRHTQIGGVITAGIGLGVVAIFVSIWISGSFHLVEGAILIILAIALGLFHSLTVEIRNSELYCHFGPGIIRKTIMLSEIDDARKVRIPWYSGWGIRWIPGQYLLWRVSGFLAVELVMKDGDRFRIGTDEPEMLVQAIQTNTIMYQKQSLRKSI
jgi:hypothetical protein